MAKKGSPNFQFDIIARVRRRTGRHKRKVNSGPTPAELRKKYPTLQDAWDKYQMVLKLVREQNTEAGEL